MGGSASTRQFMQLPDEISRDLFYQITGKGKFSPHAFEIMRDRETGITRERMMQIASTSDVYFSYEWGIDSKGRSCPRRVDLVRDYLEAKGLFVFIEDGECKQSYSAGETTAVRGEDRMMNGLKSSQCFVPFFTERYFQKLSDTVHDNQQMKEYFKFIELKGDRCILPVIFEKKGSLKSKHAPPFIKSTYEHRYCIDLINFERAQTSDSNPALEELYQYILRTITPLRDGGPFVQRKIEHTLSTEGHHYDWLMSCLRPDVPESIIHAYARLLTKEGLLTPTQLVHLLYADPKYLVSLGFDATHAAKVEIGIRKEVKDNFDFLKASAIDNVIADKKALEAAERERRIKEHKSKFDKDKDYTHVVLDVDEALEKSKMLWEMSQMRIEDALAFQIRAKKLAEEKMEKFEERKKAMVDQMDADRKRFHTLTEHIQAMLERQQQEELSWYRKERLFRILQSQTSTELCEQFRHIMAEFERNLDQVYFLDGSELIPTTGNSSSTTSKAPSAVPSTQNTPQMTSKKTLNSNALLHQKIRAISMDFNATNYLTNEPATSPYKSSEARPRLASASSANNNTKNNNSNNTGGRRGSFVGRLRGPQNIRASFATSVHQPQLLPQLLQEAALLFVQTARLCEADAKLTILLIDEGYPKLLLQFLACSYMYPTGFDTDLKSLATEMANLIVESLQQNRSKNVSSAGLTASVSVTSFLTSEVPFATLPNSNTESNSTSMIPVPSQEVQSPLITVDKEALKRFTRTSLPQDTLRTLQLLLKPRFHRRYFNEALVYLLGRAGGLELMLDIAKFHIEDALVLRAALQIMDCLLSSQEMLVFRDHVDRFMGVHQLLQQQQQQQQTFTTYNNTLTNNNSNSMISGSLFISQARPGDMLHLAMNPLVGTHVILCYFILEKHAKQNAQEVAALCWSVIVGRLLRDRRYEAIIQRLRSPLLLVQSMDSLVEAYTRPGNLSKLRSDTLLSLFQALESLYATDNDRARPYESITDGGDTHNQGLFVTYLPCVLHAHDPNAHHLLDVNTNNGNNNNIWNYFAGKERFCVSLRRRLNDHRLVLFCVQSLFDQVQQLVSTLATNNANVNNNNNNKSSGKHANQQSLNNDENESFEQMIVLIFATVRALGNIVHLRDDLKRAAVKMGVRHLHRDLPKMSLFGGSSHNHIHGWDAGRHKDKEVILRLLVDLVRFCTHKLRVQLEQPTRNNHNNTNNNTINNETICWLQLSKKQSKASLSQQEKEEKAMIFELLRESLITLAQLLPVPCLMPRDSTTNSNNNEDKDKKNQQRVYEKTKIFSWDSAETLISQYGLAELMMEIIDSHCLVSLGNVSSAMNNNMKKNDMSPEKNADGKKSTGDSASLQTAQLLYAWLILAAKLMFEGRKNICQRFVLLGICEKFCRIIDLHGAVDPLPSPTSTKSNPDAGAMMVSTSLLPTAVFEAFVSALLQLLSADPITIAPATRLIKQSRYLEHFIASHLQGACTRSIHHQANSKNNIENVRDGHGRHCGHWSHFYRLPHSSLRQGELTSLLSEHSRMQNKNKNNNDSDNVPWWEENYDSFLDQTEEAMCTSPQDHDSCPTCTTTKCTNNQNHHDISSSIISEERCFACSMLPVLVDRLIAHDETYLQEDYISYFAQQQSPSQAQQYGLRPSVWSRSVLYDNSNSNTNNNSFSLGPKPLLVRLSQTAFPRLLLPAPQIVGALIDAQVTHPRKEAKDDNLIVVSQETRTNANNGSLAVDEDVEQAEEAMFEEEKDIFLLDHHHYARRTVFPSNNTINYAANIAVEHPGLVIDRQITGGRCVECVTNILGHVFDYHVRRVFGRFQIRYGATVTKTLVVNALESMQQANLHKHLNSTNCNNNTNNNDNPWSFEKHADPPLMISLTPLDRYPPLHHPVVSNPHSYDLNKNTVAARNAALKPTPTQLYMEQEQIAHFQRLAKEDEKRAKQREKQQLKQLNDAKALEDKYIRQIWATNQHEIVLRPNNCEESALLSTPVYVNDSEDKNNLDMNNTPTKNGKTRFISAAVTEIETPFTAVTTHSHEPVPVTSTLLLQEQMKQLKSTNIAAFSDSNL